MITYDAPKQKPRAFRSLTGTSIIEFDELFQKLIPGWAWLEHERLSSTASRNTRRLLLCLRLLGDERLGWPEPPKHGKDKSIEQTLRDYPDLLAIIDATEHKACIRQSGQFS